MPKLSRHLLIAAFVLFPLISPSPAQAANCWAGYLGVGDFADVPTLKGLECIFENILSIMLQLIGLGMFLMLVYGGFKFLTAGGDAKAAEGAKSTITLGITGMVLAILAWFVLMFIQNFTGVDLTRFRIGV